VTLALLKNDCEVLQPLCLASSQFAEICRDEGFWVDVLLEKKWMPDWSAPYSPGGMTPKAYYVMICGLNDKHRSALLELSLETTTIGRYAFADCTSLALTELPPNITTIEEEAFSGCTSLVLTKLPPNLTDIGTRAFEYCTSLALTHLPPNLTVIGDNAFVDCPRLTDDGFWVEVLLKKEWMPDWSAPHSPGGITPKAYYVMIGGLNDKHRSALLGLSLETTTIESGAFDHCMSLALARLPPNLETIKELAFDSCTSLALTELPPTLITIEGWAFFGCTSLALTDLPPTLAWIGREAFADCPQLRGGEFQQAVRAINQYGM